MSVKMSTTVPFLSDSAQIAPPKTVAVIQARMGSSRLPGKMLKTLAGYSVLAWVVRAAKAIPGVDEVVVATSVSERDTALADACAGLDVTCLRGPEEDVLARYRMAAEQTNADIILRLTGDCPLLDPQVAGLVAHRLKQAFGKAGAPRYVSNATLETWPDGLDCSGFTRDALFEADQNAFLPSEREHVEPYIANRRHHFNAVFLHCPLEDMRSHRWTLDTQADFAFLEEVVEKLPGGWEAGPPAWLDVLAVMESHPDLRTLNASEDRNEGLTKTVKTDRNIGRATFQASETLLKRAEKVIPLGSQTFSKSKIQYPVGQSPLFLDHGRGGRVWDADGNEMVDLVCGLLPVVLGYADPDVDAAIRGQLDNGISFSLATELESVLAERMTEIVPCAEMIRFGKNGTDATSAAIRLSRAFTGRDRIVVVGYHGWQDWYIGSTTRNKGVPPAIRDLTLQGKFNDINSIKTLFDQFPDDIAAVIMEPMAADEPAPGFLEGVRNLTQDRGALLIFDEIITGFRFSLGGAQALFGVTPDLAAFGKAMGNGMPISAITGRADVMMEMNEVFYSGTFGGEALSLTAAIATIDKMRREPVIETLWEQGRKLSDGTNALIEKHGLSDVVTVKGKDPWKLVGFNDAPGFNEHHDIDRHALKTVFAGEMAARRVLTGTGHNICYAHTDADINQVLDAYDGTLGVLATAIQQGDISPYLKGPRLQPVFTVRAS